MSQVAIIPDEAPPHSGHFARTDPILLGQTLAQGAQISFGQGSRIATYECNGQWFRYLAGGTPFKVEVFAIKDARNLSIFSVMHTGDGLTYEFARNQDHDGIAQIVLESARDFASNMAHNV